MLVLAKPQPSSTWWVSFPQTPLTTTLISRAEGSKGETFYLWRKLSPRVLIDFLDGPSMTVCSLPWIRNFDEFSKGYFGFRVVLVHPWVADDQVYISFAFPGRFLHHRCFDSRSGRSLSECFPGSVLNLRPLNPMVFEIAIGRWRGFLARW
ncbi:hypothetical protein Acr_20g0004980 [Actinidia rufa]|uniref:Uncharacterized protein n=1 Tax=Actinidia rufa TaxID=165716 RepID=A0A7J0GD16_9ERIC|nr:hypothetical protein Acr_20g0004980 [Actinidia rufa]